MTREAAVYAVAYCAGGICLLVAVAHAIQDYLAQRRELQRRRERAHLTYLP